MPLITERVEQARNGANDKVICRMPSGWAVMGDVQFLPGYCLLLADPVVASLNDLAPQARATYLLDMARIGDAVLEATGALRINYEILGNSEPELHCHLFPRYVSEPDDKRTMPVWFYDWKTALPYAEETHGDLRKKIAQLLNAVLEASS
ncbi:HIT family protein [Pseudomonas fildesensis]|uniref:HIT family protein n=1 Tax=Pseudomonas fildesensis TaxID=1674920 RepID=UPI00387AF315